jgi:exodeoxyribonuclease VII large subunit
MANLFTSDIDFNNPKPTVNRARQPKQKINAWSTPDHIFNVSELNKTVRELLELSFPLIWLEGEVSNLSRPASGHFYFSLKDNSAQIRCALFKQTAMRTDAKALKEGSKVLLRAKLGLYEPRGDYQLIVQEVRDAGAGNLQLQYEQLLTKFKSEGLFEEARKKTLPDTIKHVGVITSSSGAAVHDVISTIQRRNPHIQVSIYPSMVQGDNAAKTIQQAIKLAVQHQQVDVLLIVRGGGSIEDLWSFNDEALAYTIAGCPIATISGVGHEVDVTIADWVADVRAPTPTAAAEMVSTDIKDQIRHFRQLSTTLEHHQQQRLQRYRVFSDQLNHRLSLVDPQRRLQQNAQRVDELSLRLQKIAQYQLFSAKQIFLQTTSRLQRVPLQQKIDQCNEKQLTLGAKLHNIVKQKLSSATQQHINLSQQLHTVSPLATIGRGYAIAFDTEGNILRKTTEVCKTDTITLKVSDGNITAKVTAITPTSSSEECY